MKFYRLDCSANFRFVIQIKNPKIITRLREWYKLKKRVNGYDLKDIMMFNEALNAYQTQIEKSLIEEKDQYFLNNADSHIFRQIRITIKKL